MYPSQPVMKPHFFAIQRLKVDRIGLYTVGCRMLVTISSISYPEVLQRAGEHSRASQHLDYHRHFYKALDHERALIDDKEKELEGGKASRGKRSKTSNTQTKDAERHDKKDAYDLARFCKKAWLCLRGLTDLSCDSKQSNATADTHTKRKLPSSPPIFTLKM
ncbi:hypothetical protein D5086_028724 [Populus alba]|uniref:Uncharacterized protein n=1 Tax=Populus alba TaxID=43335 RepID=A0ACC4AS48_POPAL